VIDTLRADAVGSYGSTTETPHLDAIAAAGLRFADVVAQAPWTVPSLSSLLTGRYPFEHGQGAHVSAAGATPTLGEHLAKAGYTTAAFVEADWALLRRGFQTYEQPMGSTEERFGWAGSREPSPTFRSAIEWLGSSAKQPFFLLVHSYEVHDYFLGRPRHREYARARHPSYRGRYADWRQRPLDENGIDRMIADLLAASPEDNAYVRSLYDGAVRVADEEVGRLDRALAEKGVTDETILVVTSDHGEGFSPELRRVSHGGRLHDDLLRVPLLVRWPGRIAPGLVSTRVESIDVAPTLLRLTGVAADPIGEARLRGAPLLARTGTPPAERWVPAVDGDVAFAEESAFAVRPSGRREPSTAHQAAVYAGERKLIRSAAGEEVFDLARDPEETTNARADDPAAAGRLASEMDRIVGDLERPPAGPRKDIEEALRSLGYAR
jgi:arylsulfatase A-like enzyme